MGLVDVHSHILFGVDDGPSDKEESLSILSGLFQIGYTTVCATPHIRPSVFSDCENARTSFTLLQKEVEAETIPIELYLGGEHYIDGLFWDILARGEVLPYNNTKTILVEFILGKLPYNWRDVIYQIQLRGYQAALAHAERFDFIQRDYSVTEELISRGVIIQCDLMSLIGKYNSASERTIKRLLKDHLCHLLTTDIHSQEDLTFIEHSLSELDGHVSPSYRRDLLHRNPKAVLRGEQVVLCRDKNSPDY